MNNKQIESILYAKSGLQGFHKNLGRKANQAFINAIIFKAQQNVKQAKTLANEYKIRTKFVANYKEALEALKKTNAEQRAELSKLLTKVNKLASPAGRPPLAPRRTPTPARARANLRSLMQQQIAALTAQRNAISRQINSIEARLRQLPSI
jgi:DNA repair exonuclease SbcCD ATPase subunit